MTLETMQREGRDGFRQDFTSDCEGYIDCIKGQLDKLDQHTASTWEAAQESMYKQMEDWQSLRTATDEPTNAAQVMNQLLFLIK